MAEVKINWSTNSSPLRVAGKMSSSSYTSSTTCKLPWKEPYNVYYDPMHAVFPDNCTLTFQGAATEKMMGLGRLPK